MAAESAAAAVTRNLVAFPGDPDLDCHLTGLRLASLIESPAADYHVEAVLGFDGAAASGWWIGRDTGERDEVERVDNMEVAFGYNMQPGYELYADWQVTVLRRWLEDGALIEMTSAPGKWSLLASGTDRVVVPRKMVTAGRG